jgi:hypothetical protein
MPTIQCHCGAVKVSLEKGFPAAFGGSNDVVDW